MEKKRILCLDLDGTVRRSKSGKDFIEGPDDIEIIPGMRDLIHKYRKEDWITVGISNQGGVAHGFKTQDDVQLEIDKTCELLQLEIDANTLCFLQVIFWCPYQAGGKVEEFNWRSLRRKPNYGMLARAEEILVDENIIPDWDNSLFVGDRPEDEECAKAAGIPFMWAHDFIKQPL